jgi:hypothetical protein
LRARLVQLEEGERASVHPLDRRELVIGRDSAEADLVLDGFARISRRHASIRPFGSGYAVVDLGSSNGTKVNGDPVATRPVALEDGDHIELSGEVEFVYEERGGAGRILVALAVLLLLAGAGWAVHRWMLARPAPPPFPEHAVALAQEAATAWRAGNAETAKKHLLSAAGLLYREGILDDVPRAEVMQAAMQRLGERLPEHPDLWEVFQGSVERVDKKREEAARPAVAAGPKCRLDQVPPEEFRPCLRDWVHQVLIGLRQDPADIPPEAFFDAIVRRMRVHAERELFERAQARREQVVPMMEVELERAHLPPMLHYLSLIESGYSTNAGSPVGAVGPWQFIPATARRYGLRTDAPDERRDPERSTQAAAKYLKDLLLEFGPDSLLLAMASYNRGENGVRAALRKLDDPFSERSFWRLVEKGLLPDETADYVPRFMAHAAWGEGGFPPEEVVARVPIHAASAP